MASTLVVQVALYITQHQNGTTTYMDENGQMYVPLGEELHADHGTIINSNIDIERAIIFASISLILVILGGITSGLNVALLSIDAKKNELMLKLEAKNTERIQKRAAASKNIDAHQEEEKEDDTKQVMMKMMAKVQPIINDRHLLLVTLLVANATAMEALPIFLDELVVSWLAIVISVTFVLIFGEILPQAFFSSDPLKAGYKMYYIVLIMKWILFPICKPIACFLDLIFGAEHQDHTIRFTQKEVSMIMMEIGDHPDQKTVVEGALDIGGCTVMHSIVPWIDVVCLDANTKLDADGLKAIYKTGRSRIPIYENRRDNIIGILLVKMLIICDPDPELTLKQYLTYNFKKVPLPSLVVPNTNLYDTINIFQDKKTHFAMVCQSEDEFDILECWRDGKPIPGQIKWAGIITLEDVMEDIIQEDIFDEFDVETTGNLLKLNSNSLLKLEEHKSNWTEDRSFIESIHSRYSAKNKMTARAKKIKLERKKSFKSHQAISALADDSEISEPQKEEFQKPLLSVDKTSINVKANDYGAIITSNDVNLHNQ